MDSTEKQKPRQKRVTASWQRIIMRTLSFRDKLRITGHRTRDVSILTDYYPSYFPENIENFGVILKGKSIEKIGKVCHNYNDCFIVNNFDKEIELLEKYLVAKNTVHFVNALMTAPLTPENYKKTGITDIQLSRASAKGIEKAIKYYKSLGLRIHFLPKRLLEFNRDIDADYSGKEYRYPNTGVQAIIYALDIIRPKNLWLVGLDFYQQDYLVRRPHQSLLEQQRAQIKRLDLINVFVSILKRYPEVNVNMVTYYEGLPELKNLSVL